MDSDGDLTIKDATLIQNFLASGDNQKNCDWIIHFKQKFLADVGGDGIPITCATEIELYKQVEKYEGFLEIEH